MTFRSRFDGALDEWNRSVVQLNDAIASFMNDGLQTEGGVWILTMNQSKGDTLRAARHREDVARAALHRIIDDVRQVEGGHQSTAVTNGSQRPSAPPPDGAH